VRLRINTKWHNKGREVTIEERANTMAFIAWKIAAGFVLDMENEEFQTDSQSMRLDIIKECLAFMVSVTDRLVAEQLSQEERQELITKMALKTAKTLQENSEDLIGRGQDYQQDYINMLNERLNAYAHCSWDAEREEPGFQYKRDFGDYVAAVMGARDNKWIAQQVMEIEVPEIIENLKKGKKQMVDGRDMSDEGERALRKANRGDE
jgi:hypothetical protein